MAAVTCPGAVYHPYIALQVMQAFEVMHFRVQCAFGLLQVSTGHLTSPFENPRATSDVMCSHVLAHMGINTAYNYLLQHVCIYASLPESNRRSLPQHHSPS